MHCHINSANCSLLLTGGPKLTASQSILEDLLEAQKLEDTQIHSGVESQATLVGAQCGVKLHTVATVDLRLELVIFPDNTELNNSLWDLDDLQSSLVLWVLLKETGRLQGRGKLCKEDCQIRSMSPGGKLDNSHSMTVAIG